MNANKFIYFISSVLLLPQKICNEFYIFTRGIKNENLFTVIFRTFALIIRLLFLLNLHLILYIYNNYSFSIYFNISIFIAINIVYFYMYKKSSLYIGEISTNYFFTFLTMNLLLIITLVLCLIDFIFSGGNDSSIQIILIKIRKGVFVIPMIKLIFHVLWNTTVNIIKYMLIITHMLNPISLLRIYYFYKMDDPYLILKLFFSCFLILTHDLLLLLIFLFNQLFFVSAFNSNYFLFNVLINSEGNTLKKQTLILLNSGSLTNYRQSFYFILKYKLILENFYKNIEFIFYCLFLFLNMIFIWRYYHLKSIWRKYFLDKKSIFFDLLINFLDGFLESISWFFILLNYIYNPKGIQLLNSHLKLKYKDNFISYLDFQINYFLIKFLDLIVTLLSVFRLLTLTFYFQLIREISKDKPSNFFLLPLFDESKIWNKIISKSSDDILKRIYSKYNKRRNKLLLITIMSFADQLFFSFSIIIFIVPFNILKFIKNLVIFLQNTIYNFNRSFISINTDFKYSQLRLIYSSLYDFICFLPLSTMICSLPPFMNFYILFKFMVKIYIFNPISKIRNYKIGKNNSSIYKSLRPSTNFKFLINLLKKTAWQWDLVLRIILVHFSIFRLFKFWKQYYFVFGYKKIRSADVRKSINEKSIYIINESIEVITSNTDIINTRRKAIFKRYSQNTINFTKKSYFKLFKEYTYKNSQPILKELIFYPFMLIISILTPWNIKHFQNFYEHSSFTDKFLEFRKFSYLFISDILTFLSTIFLILSIVKTIDTFILIYYSLRKNISKNYDRERLYNFYYKSNFKGCIYEMMRSLISDFIILSLIILNTILITRIFHLFKRIRYYFHSKIKEDISKFKHFIKIHNLNYPQLNNINVGESTKEFDRAFRKIAEFLSPSEILNLSLTNKYWLLVLNTNDVWRSCYENHYKTQLIIKKKEEILKHINTRVFENFKSLCREISSYLKSTADIDHFRRDNLIGLLQVLMEETIESFFNIPHLFIIPIKILSISIVYFRSKFFNYLKHLNLFIKFKSQIYDYSYNSFYKIDHDKFTRFLDFTEFDSFYLNLQIIGFVSLIDFLLIISEIIVNLFLYSNLLLIKLLLKTKYHNFVFYKFNIMILKISLIIYHSVLFIIPFVLSNLNNIKIIFESIKYNSLYENSYSIKEILFIFFNIFHSQSLLNKIFVIIGNYGINLVPYLLNYLYIKKMFEILKNSKYYDLYNTIYYIYNPAGFINDFLTFIKRNIIYGMFPQILFVNYLKNKIEISLIGSIINKFLIISLWLLPFLLNIIITMSFSRLFIINLYAIINIIVIKF